MKLRVESAECRTPDHTARFASVTFPGSGEVNREVLRSRTPGPPDRVIYRATLLVTNEDRALSSLEISDWRVAAGMNINV
jgi:hypothetical protein